jgi:hypothetical protein
MQEKARAPGGDGQRRRGLRAVRESGSAVVKATIRLTAANYQRLTLAAMMDGGGDKSAIVNGLVAAHLPNYVVSERGAGGKADAA